VATEELAEDVVTAADTALEGLTADAAADRESGRPVVGEAAGVRGAER
jgi:hypothetical protein